MRRNLCHLLNATLAIAISCSLNTAIHAQTFPYQATVQTEGALVLSGPGKKYYATQSLSRGTKVQVLRHDRGGWYMIAPPQGSFSLVRADSIQTTAAGKGIVVADDAIAWVGSSLNGSLDVMQEQLVKNNSVQILGMVSVERDGETTSMYQITPPRNERRWISADAFQAVQNSAKQVIGNDPFDVIDAATSAGFETEKPSDSKIQKVAAELDKIEPLFPTGKTQVKLEATGENRQQQTDDELISDGVRRSGPATEQLVERRQKLRDVDRQLTAMLAKDKSEWDFSALEAEYQKLAAEFPDAPALESKLLMRASAIERYKNVKKSYDEFVQLTSATTARDEELRAVQEQSLVVLSDAVREANPSLPTALPVDAGSPLPQSGSIPIPTTDTDSQTAVSQTIVQSGGVQPAGNQAAPYNSQLQYQQQMQQQQQIQQHQQQSAYGYRRPASGQSMYNSYGYRQNPQGPAINGQQNQYGQANPYAQRQMPHRFPWQQASQQQYRQQQYQGYNYQQPYQQRPYQANPGQPNASQAPQAQYQPQGNAYYPAQPQMQAARQQQFRAAGISPQPIPQPVPQSQMLQAGVPATGVSAAGGAGQPTFATNAVNQEQLLPSQPQGPSPFNGTGVIRRISGDLGGMPPHALVAGDGRVIGFLQAPQGTNLDQWVDKSVGIQGQRSHRADWHTDAIVIQKVSPAAP